MAWITPVFDRVLADITGLTAKGYFNIADHARIDGNSTVIKAMLDASDYLDIPLYSLTPPTITTIPTVANINQLIENIERLRQAACLPAAMGMNTLKYDFEGGANEIAPDYLDVNDWEENQTIIYDAIPKAISYWVSCGVAASGQSRLWQHRFR